MRDELVCKGTGYFLIYKKILEKIIGKNHIFTIFTIFTILVGGTKVILTFAM